MIKFLIFLIAITPLVAPSQTSIIKRNTGELVIQGTIISFKEPVDYIYIICLDGNNNGIDSVRVINNKYSFRIQTGATTLVTLFAKPAIDPDVFKPKNMLTLIVEPTTVIIASTDSLANAKVSGSMAYLEYKLLEAGAEPYRSQLRTFIKGHSKSVETADKEGRLLFQKKIDSTRQKLYANVYYKYIKTKPSSILINYALNQYVGSLEDNASDNEVEKVALIYSKLSRKEKDSYFGRRIKKKIDSYKISIGMVAPEIVQADMLGNTVSLSSYKGKYVLLDFWASWCAPCRRDFSQIKELYKEYNKYGFEIIGISKDTDTTAYHKAIEKDGINVWVNTLINEKTTKSYFVSAIPMKILINTKGIVIGIWREGGEENFNSLKNLIEKNITIN